MTPKEKAEKLFNEVNILIPIDANINDTGKEAYEKMKSDHVATKKICLLIVSEIKNANGSETSHWTGKKWVDFETYFNEVEQEIEKL